MKSIIILVILIGTSYAFQDHCQGSYLAAVREFCVTKHGGDRAHIHDLIDLRKARNEDGKCFRACILTECDYFGHDGKFTADVPRRVAWLLHGEDVTKLNAIEKVAADCVALQNYNDNLCNISEAYYRCLVDRTTVPLKFTDSIIKDTAPEMAWNI